MLITRRLVSYLTRTFNRSPDPLPALAVASVNAAPLTADSTTVTADDAVITADATVLGSVAPALWHVEDAVLTLSVESSPGSERSFSLEGKTLAQLATEITAEPGYQASVFDLSLIDRGAWALIDGAGNSSAPIPVYTAIEWTVLDAIAKALTDARRATVEALRQLVVSTAEDDWLDFHADRYGFPRAPGEGDDELRRRVIASVLRIKSNNRAIEEIVLELFGVMVEVRDIPWAIASVTMHTFGGQLWTPAQVTNDPDIRTAPGVVVIDTSVISDFSLQTLPDGSPAWGDPANGNRLQCAFAVIFPSDTDAAVAAAIMDAIRSIRAAGTIALSYIRNASLITNQATDVTNDPAYVTGPASSGFSRWFP